MDCSAPAKTEIRILDGPVTPAMFGAGGDLDRDPGLLLEGRGRPFQGGVGPTRTVEVITPSPAWMDWVGLGIGGEGRPAAAGMRAEQSRASQEGLDFIVSP